MSATGHRRFAYTYPRRVSLTAGWHTRYLTATPTRRLVRPGRRP